MNVPVDVPSFPFIIARDVAVFPAVISAFTRAVMSKVKKSHLFPEKMN
jgi:hypothetical protein